MYTIKLYTAVYAASLLYVQHTLYINNLIHPVDWFPSRETEQSFQIQNDAVIVFSCRTFQLEIV